MSKSIKAVLPQKEIIHSIVQKAEDDRRRSKYKCMYYSRTSCDKTLMKCPGSTFCKYYHEIITEENDEEEGIKQDSRIQFSLMNMQETVQKKKVKKKAFLLIPINEKQFIQIKDRIKNRKGEYIDLLIMNLDEFRDYELYYFKRVYLKYNNEIIQFSIPNSKIDFIESGNVLTIHIEYQALHRNKALKDKTVLLWSYEDDIYGTVEFRR